MIIAITTFPGGRARAPEILHWCADNGFSPSDVRLPCWIDTEHRTIRLSKIIPVEGQEDEDFPEPQTNAQGLPLTVDIITPLLVDPPTWLTAEASAA